ncbi:unnamed protein product, partial [marine sediment metagenome]
SLSPLVKNREVLAKVEQELQARNPAIVEETGITHPTLTTKEMELANTIERILKSRELKVRRVELSCLSSS